LEKTYLEKIIEETLRPVLGALKVLSQELAASMHIPDAPWKILNKPYEALTEQELLALADIYHTDGEVEPCPFCNWVTRAELVLARKNKRELGG